MSQKVNKKIPQKQAPPVKKAAPSKPFDYKWLWLAAILVLTFIVFYPALQAEFTNWDDNVYLNENKLITGLSFDHIKKIFSIDNPVSLNYHPITILSLAIDYHFSKLAPFRYHLVNLVLHLLNTALVFFFAYKLSKKNLFVAIFVSLFFGIHPMHVESVAWVAERKDVLYAFFFLSALITYLLYRETKKVIYIVFTFFLFLLSVLSKAMAVVLPLVLLLVDYYRGRKITWKVLAEKIPFFLVALLFGALAVHIQSGKAIASYGLFTFYQRLSFGFYGFITYIWKLFLPVHLSGFYPYPITDIYGIIPLSFYLIAGGGLLIFLAVIMFSFIWKDRMKVITFGFAFFFLTIVTVLQFMSVGQVIMAERYSYIPYIGLFFTLAMLLHQLLEKMPAFKVPAFVFVLAAAITLSVVTYGRAQAWKNSATFWTDVIEKYPFPPWTVQVAFENRGNYYAREHELYDEGLADYNVLVKQMKTRNYNIFKNIGNIYGLKGQAFARQGDTANFRAYSLRAIAAYDTAIALNPKDADMYINLAITYAAMNQPDSEAIYYGKVVSLLPGEVEYVERQGMAWFKAGNFREAASCFLTQSKLQPQNHNAVYNASVCYDHLGEKASALSYALKAKQMGHAVDDKYLDGLRRAVK